MPVVSLTNSSGIVEVLALRTLYTYCPTIFDAGEAFAGAPFTPEWPPAPTTFAGASVPESLIPTNGGWSSRSSNSETPAVRLPWVWVQSGAPEAVEDLDGMSQIVRVPIVAFYRGRRSDADGVTLGRALLRPRAEMAALAMQHVLQVYLPQVTVAVEPTQRFGIMYVETEGIAVAGEGQSTMDDNLDGAMRDINYCDAATRVWVYQHRRDDQGTT